MRVSKTRREKEIREEREREGDKYYGIQGVIY